MRAAFKEDILTNTSYPAEKLLEFVKKDIVVGDVFIDELLNTQYDDPKSFSILALLFPIQDLKNNDFHKDHLYPKNEFENLSEIDRSKYTYKDYNSIVNLQLLDANENMSKNKLSLDKWVEKKYFR